MNPTEAEIKRWPRWRRIAYAIAPFNRLGIPKNINEWIEFVTVVYGEESCNFYIGVFERCNEAAKKGLL